MGIDHVRLGGMHCSLCRRGCTGTGDGSSCLRGIRSTGHARLVDNRSGNHPVWMCNGPTPCIVWTTTCVDAVCKACCGFVWRLAEWVMEWRPSCPVSHAMTFESWFPWWEIPMKQAHHVSPFCAHHEYFSSICWFAHVEPEWCESSFCGECQYRLSETLWDLHTCRAVQCILRGPNQCDDQLPCVQLRHTHQIDVECQPCGWESTWGIWPQHEGLLLIVPLMISNDALMLWKAKYGKLETWKLGLPLGLIAIRQIKKVIQFFWVHMHFWNDILIWSGQFICLTL